MKSNLLKSISINDLLYFLILMVLILIICFKCISIHQNLTENFENTNTNTNNNNTNNNNSNNNSNNNTNNNSNNNTNNNNTNNNSELLNEINSLSKELENNLGSNLEGNIEEVSEENMTHQEKVDLMKKCVSIETGEWGSVTSKYSGKVINVESLGKNNGVVKYLIKWQPLGGKAGGCITCNADGTYSTPMCNTNINKQQWYIIKIKNKEQWLREIPEDRRNMGRSMENTEFPFYIIQSVEFPNYVLNYEGGGLSIREKSNYDGQKWDVSQGKIVQDPLPTQEQSKFVHLTPGHNKSSADVPIGSLLNGNGNGNGNGKGNGNGDESVNLNINLDPNLLNQLISNNIENNSERNNILGNTNMSNNNSGLINGLNSTGGRGDISSLLKDKLENPLCEDCGPIPENYIKKDLVKSMCIGCNNIDNVLT